MYKDSKLHHTVQTRRYDGRKWWDHSDTQCASSMHVNAIGGKRARMPDDAPLPTPLPPTSISGDSSRKWTSPDATDSMTERRWKGVMLVWIHAPRTHSGNSLTYIIDITRTVTYCIAVGPGNAQFMSIRQVLPRRGMCGWLLLLPLQHRCCSWCWCCC